jgi:hypothetical protein
MVIMIDPRIISTIRIHARWEEDRYVPARFEWQGDSRIVAITFDLWNKADPTYVQTPALVSTKPGSMATFGPFRLRVIEVDQSRELVFCERMEWDVVISRAPSPFDEVEG